MSITTTTIIIITTTITMTTITMTTTTNTRYHAGFRRLRHTVKATLYQSPDVRAMIDDLLERAQNDQQAQTLGLSVVSVYQCCLSPPLFVVFVF